MTKVLVLGRSGQVGSELFSLSSSYPQYSFIFADRSVLDLSSPESIKVYFSSNHCDVIVNCAAYTAVDKAETERDLADAINHRSVAALAEVALEKNISLVHISTDYVFNGKNFKPYVEDDQTDPVNHYGATKRLGEEAILKFAPKKTIIIRTSWVYSVFGNNFMKTMLRLGRERESLNVIVDQVGTPTNARDLAKFILDILPKIKNEKPEIYHYSNDGVASWFDFAREIFDLANFKCELRAIPSTEYVTPAKRPYYSLMSKDKTKKEFQIHIPHWRISLAKSLKEMNF